MGIAPLNYIKISMSEQDNTIEVGNTDTTEPEAEIIPSEKINMKGFEPNLTIICEKVKSMNIQGIFSLEIIVGPARHETERFELYQNKEFVPEDIGTNMRINWKHVDECKVLVNLIQRGNIIGGADYDLSRLYQSEHNVVKVELSIEDYDCFKALGSIEVELTRWNKVIMEKDIAAQRLLIDEHLHKNVKNITARQLEIVDELVPLNDGFTKAIRLETAENFFSKIMEKGREFIASACIPADTTENVKPETSESDVKGNQDDDNVDGSPITKKLDEEYHVRAKIDLPAFDLRNEAQVYVALGTNEIQRTVAKFNEIKAQYGQRAYVRECLRNKIHQITEVLDGETMQSNNAARIMAARAMGDTEEEAQVGVDGAKTNYELVVQSCRRVRRLVASAYELAARPPSRYSKEKNPVFLLPIPRLQVITIKEKGNGESIPSRAELDAEYPKEVSSEEEEEHSYDTIDSNEETCGSDTSHSVDEASNINGTSASSVEPDTPYKEPEPVQEDYDKLSEGLSTA